MNELIKVPVLRGFLNGREHVDIGDEIEVTLHRARELAINGLVLLPDGEVVDKNAPRPLTLGGEVGIVSAAGASTAQQETKEDAVDTTTTTAEGKTEKKQSDPANKKASEPKNKSA